MNAPVVEARTARIQAPAKVNLSLRIVGRREDGYHLLESDIVPIEVFDQVGLGAAPATATSITLACQPGVGGSDAENLAVRAAALFLQRTKILCRVEISLRKEIPVGAGLGGGSSDAAAVLKGLNGITRAGVPLSRLVEWALELGADVPFFVLGRAASIRGVGERLRPMRAFVPRPLVVAFPGWGLSTREVFRAYDDSLTRSASASRKAVFDSGDSPRRQSVRNDLEAVVFRLRPELKQLRERLLAAGASEAWMSGSGSALVGFWESWNDARRAAEEMRRDGIWARAVGGLDRMPEPIVE